MAKLKLSILIVGEAIEPGAYCPCNTQKSDLENSAIEYDLDHTFEKIDPENSEYSYAEVWNSFNFEETEDQGADELFSFQISGLLDWEQGFKFLDSIGAIYEDCETMGTLGGPLNPIGFVPDFPFRLESQLIVDCIRVTPFNPNAKKPMTESTWGRIRQLLRDHDCYDLARMNNAEFIENRRRPKKRFFVFINLFNKLWKPISRDQVAKTIKLYRRHKSAYRQGDHVYKLLCMFDQVTIAPESPERKTK